MSVGGFKVVDSLSRDEWVAFRDLAQESLEAWGAGDEMHVSGTTEQDLRELVLYCETQLVRLDQGLEPAGARRPLLAVMRAMEPAVRQHIKLS